MERNHFDKSYEYALICSRQTVYLIALKKRHVTLVFGISINVHRQLNSRPNRCDLHASHMFDRATPVRCQKNKCWGRWVQAHILVSPSVFGVTDGLYL